MEETFYTKAIVLKRAAFRERDSKIIVYSLKHGRMDLVARGTKKILSKLAGHLEPFTLIDLMVIKGKQFDYVGSAVSAESFREIKNNLEKTFLVGDIFKLFDALIKDNVSDPQIFSLLLDFLLLENISTLNSEEARLLAVAFEIKLICYLGYQANLGSCTVCGQKKSSDECIFDFVKGGLVCQKCEQLKNKDSQKISSSLIKNYNLISEVDLKEILKMIIKEDEIKELKDFVDAYILANVK
jgi:DNA repair protein RecO (recombination protein O)